MPLLFVWHWEAAPVTEPTTPCQLAARLAHDVGKYTARTARNVAADGWTPELVAMLCRDLYPQDRHLSLRFAELAYEHAATALAVDEYVTLAGADAFDARALGLLVERVMARRPHAADPGLYRWGRSPGMARIKRDALVLARTSLPILLLGESGTGKSALA
jgi:transcriptional regulator of acetoin/glycerol metabolism